MEALIKVLLVRLEKTPRRRLYAINSGNELCALFLTPEEAKAALFISPGGGRKRRQNQTFHPSFDYETSI